MTKYVAVTDGSLLNPAAAAIRAAQSRDAAERADERARIVAAALHIEVEGDKPDPRQRTQTPSPRPVRGDAQVASGGGAKPKRWEDQSPAERAEEAARSFEAVAQHLRQKGTRS